MIRTKKAVNESKNLSSWHLSEEGVLVCTDEHGFMKLQNLYFPKVVYVVDYAIANVSWSNGFKVDALDIVLDAFE